MLLLVKFSLKLLENLVQSTISINSPLYVVRNVSDVKLYEEMFAGTVVFKMVSFVSDASSTTLQEMQETPKLVSIKATSYTINKM